MEAPEVPTEHLHEEIHEHVHGSKEKWTSFLAVATAIMAGLAAIASLISGDFETKSMLETLQASDQWAYFQAKGSKAAILSGEIKVLQALGKPADPQDLEKLDRYKGEQETIQETAKSLEEASERHLSRHEVLAKSVTLFQISIAIAAISILMKRRSFFYVSLGTTLVGLILLLSQFMPQAIGSPH
jgi:hypothetical protein